MATALAVLMAAAAGASCGGGSSSADASRELRPLLNDLRSINESTPELPRDASCRALVFFRDKGSWPGETDWADILASSGLSATSEQLKALVLRYDLQTGAQDSSLSSTDQANQAIEQLGCAALSG